MASPFLFMALFAPSASLLERLSETACFFPPPPDLFLDRFALPSRARLDSQKFVSSLFFFFLGENWNARRLRCFDSRMRCKRL